MSILPSLRFLLILICSTACSTLSVWAQPPDRIFFNGRVVTVDSQFHIAEAVATAGERITAVGTTAELLSSAGPTTERIDLQGKMLLPGLIDSHVHATGASTFEFDHAVPDVRSVAEALDYIRQRAEVLEDGQWIRVQQMFITRLEERRFPTREELDQVAPRNPVIFRTGPDIAVNSLALEQSGIAEDYQLPEGSTGRIERDAQGKMTGIIRGESGVIKYEESLASPTADQRRQLLRQLLHDYNSVGLTSVSDRNVSRSALDLYSEMHRDNELSVRVFLYYGINPDSNPATIEQQLQELRSHPLHAYNDRLWLRGIKVFLDGGMLTGSAYMREPWGKSDIYSITDPEYRGTLKITPERLYQISRMALSAGFQMTAHAVGDGAVHNLIDAYERVAEEIDLKSARPCITHCNFMSASAIERMQRLGIVADLQPAWLYLDGATLEKQFGYQRLEYFQPYLALFEAGVVVGGGSDHMQKIGSMRSVNPYNPFLGMWIALTRQPRGSDKPLHPEQKLSRAQAIQLYTINNAYLSFEEQQKGSIEVGKLADMIVIDRDLLECPAEEVRDTQVLQTYLGGQLVWEHK